jgi:hypothetical protein
VIEVGVSAGDLSAGKAGEVVLELRNGGTGPCTHIVFKLAMPEEVALLSGGVRVEVPRLEAGASITRVLRVRSDTAGMWPIRSANFSYRDERGLTKRVHDFATHVAVLPPQVVVPVPEPRFTVELVDRELAGHGWTVLRGRVTNNGVPVLVGVRAHISGPLEVDSRSAWQELGTLPPGETAEFSVHVNSTSGGSHVPVHVRVVCGTDAGLSRSKEHTFTVRVVSTPQPDRSADQVKVLYLAANPTDTQRLNLDLELRTIRERMRMGEHRDGFLLDSRTALRVGDITEALLEFRPRIVHFSGHAAPDGRLYVSNESGGSVLVPVEGLAALFKIVSDHVECVIVNACDTEVLAEALSEDVDVIGMRQAIGDRAAIRFSFGFYQALVANRTVEEAYEMACVQIQLDPHAGPQHRVPLLLKRKR